MENLTAGVPHGRGDEPINRPPLLNGYRVPHGRGDEPEKEHKDNLLLLCSPRAWG